MTTTVNVLVPISTVVTQTVVLQTSFISIFVTAVAEQISYDPTTTVTISTEAEAPSVSTVSVQSTISEGSGSSLGFSASLPVVTELSSVALPIVTSAVAVSSSYTTAVSSPSPSSSSTTNSTMPATSAAHGSSRSTKTSIVAGLTGAIAGLLIVGLIIFLILRWRRRKNGKFLDYAEEKDSKRHGHNHKHKHKRKHKHRSQRKWNDVGQARDVPLSAAQLSAVGLAAAKESGVTVDEDLRIIRMSTQHWPRPFAQGSGEGYRDSFPAGQLRVVNPDPTTRPPSSRISSDTARDFLRRQCTALSDIIFRSPRSRAGSRTQQHIQTSHPLANELSTPSAADPVPLHESMTAPAAVAIARLPSFSKRSFVGGMSVSTRSIVGQVPPEDPFLTPPAQEYHALSYDNAASLEANILSNHDQSYPRPAMLHAATGATSKHFNAAMTALSFFPSKNTLASKFKFEYSSEPNVVVNSYPRTPQSLRTYSLSIISSTSPTIPVDAARLYCHSNSTALLPSPIPTATKSHTGPEPVFIYPAIEPHSAISAASSHASRRSDPFDLDRPSVRGSMSSTVDRDVFDGKGATVHEKEIGVAIGEVQHHTTRKTSSQLRGESWSLYEGT